MDVECTLARSRVGSGRSLCCASAATCSMLTSSVIQYVEDADEGHHIPLPNWANATSASATKNSSFETREPRELTRFTI